MRDLKHSLLLFTLAIILFIYSFKIFALMTLLVSLSKLYNWYQHPHRQLWELIKKDAKKFQIQIPNKQPIKQNLLKLYSRVELLRLYQPYLKETIADLLYAMWKGLKYNSNLLTWSGEINQTTLSLPSFNSSEFDKQRVRFKTQASKDQQLWEYAAQKASRP